MPLPQRHPREGGGPEGRLKAGFPPVSFRTGQQRACRRGEFLPFPKLTQRKECRVPTVWGWGLLALVCLGLAALYVETIHSFLAVSRPVRGSILVIEGWISSPTALKQAVNEFKSHGYELLVVGRDEEKPWVPSVLVKCGMTESRMVLVPVPHVEKDRTYASALATRDWLASHEVRSPSIDVFTVGTHARRSWMLFRHALGSRVRVGIISSPNLYYDPDHWWRSSEGFKEVLYETLACLYTYVFRFSWNPEGVVPPASEPRHEG